MPNQIKKLRFVPSILSLLDGVHFLFQYGFYNLLMTFMRQYTYTFTTPFILFPWYQLPQRTVDTIAIKQQLLSQYDVIQSRIKDLKEAAEKEVCSLRICSGAVN